MKCKDVKVLYLARYAPECSSDDPYGYLEDEGRTYREYHNTLYAILKDLFFHIDSTRDPSFLIEHHSQYDYVFSLYNRMPFRNSEVFISSICEYYGIPYLGARPNIRALAEDKHLAKMMALYAGVKTPEWRVYNTDSEVCAPNFSPPYFCKPRFGAASEGIDESSLCETWDVAKEKIKGYQNCSIDVILEKQISGVYYTSPVLNNFQSYQALPCVEERSNKKCGIVTHAQKRKMESGLFRNVTSDRTLQDRLQKSSLNMFDLIQPLDYTRFDYIVDGETQTPYFIEFNICCNLGEHSTIAQAAMHIGIKYDDLLKNIVFSSMWRQNLLHDTFGYKI